MLDRPRAVVGGDRPDADICYKSGPVGDSRRGRGDALHISDRGGGAASGWDRF